MPKLEVVEAFRKRTLFFYGFPQSHNAHVSRPWWRGHTRADGVCIGFQRFQKMSGWVLWLRRDDRYELGFPREDQEEEVLAFVDREHPLPAPPPLPGQVWVIEDSAQKCLVTGVSRTGRASFADMLGTASPPSWPPPGAVLAHGPSCYGENVPWAPPDWKV